MLEMRCDFCSSPNPAWIHYCPEFVFEEVYFENAEWMACDICHSLIQSKEVDTLALRSTNLYPFEKRESLFEEILGLHKVVLSLMSDESEKMGKK